MTVMIKDVLQVDCGGIPQAWIARSDAACLISCGDFSWLSNEFVATILGGFKGDGTRSSLRIPSVLATTGRGRSDWLNYVPSLNTRNNKLFARDKFQCAYCGGVFHPAKLSRDHIIPTSRGGEDVWENVVTSCMDCNRRKSNRTPKEAGMPLIFAPFTPNFIQDFYMERFGREITVGQQSVLSNFAMSMRNENSSH